MKIKLNTKDELNKFLDICSHYKFDIDACYGRYIIDARSMLGMMGIGLEKTIEIVAYTDTQKNSDKFYNEIKRWEVTS